MRAAGPLNAFAHFLRVAMHTTRLVGLVASRSGGSSGSCNVVGVGGLAGCGSLLVVAVDPRVCVAAFVGSRASAVLLGVAWLPWASRGSPRICSGPHGVYRLLVVLVLMGSLADRAALCSRSSTTAAGVRRRNKSKKKDASLVHPLPRLHRGSPSSVDRPPMTCAARVRYGVDSGLQPLGNRVMWRLPARRAAAAMRRKAATMRSHSGHPRKVKTGVGDDDSHGAGDCKPGQRAGSPGNLDMRRPTSRKRGPPSTRS